MIVTSWFFIGVGFGAFGIFSHDTIAEMTNEVLGKGDVTESLTHVSGSSRLLPACALAVVTIAGAHYSVSRKLGVFDFP